MGLRRTSHAVYDSQYHLVWAPKYRKWILRGDLRAYVVVAVEKNVECLVAAQPAIPHSRPRSHQSKLHLPLRRNR